MKAEVTKADPVPQPPDTVSVTMTLDQARALKTFLGDLGHDGLSRFYDLGWTYEFDRGSDPLFKEMCTVRDFVFTPLYEALKDAGVRNEYGWGGLLGIAEEGRKK